MNYLKVILTIIAVLLLSISFHLIHSKALLAVLNQNYQLVTNSNQAIITSNQHLENGLLELKKQIEETSNKFLSNNP